VVDRKTRSPGTFALGTEEYERTMARGFAVIDDLHDRNADKDPDQIERDVTAAVEAVRQEMYAERRRPRRKSGR
jgi:hypothetical protein